MRVSGHQSPDDRCDLPRKQRRYGISDLMELPRPPALEKVVVRKSLQPSRLPVRKRSITFNVVSDAGHTRSAKLTAVISRIRTYPSCDHVHTPSKLLKHVWSPQ